MPSRLKISRSGVTTRHPAARAVKDHIASIITRPPAFIIWKAFKVLRHTASNPSKCVQFYPVPVLVSRISARSQLRKSLL